MTEYFDFDEQDELDQLLAEPEDKDQSFQKPAQAPEVVDSKFEFELELEQQDVIANQLTELSLEPQSFEAEDEENKLTELEEKLELLLNPDYFRERLREANQEEYYK